MENNNNKTMKCMTYEFKYDENGKFIEIKTGEIEIDGFEISYVIKTGGGAQ